MLSQYKPVIEKKVAAYIGNIPVHPNVVTLAGMVPSFLFMYFLLHGNYTSALFAYLGNFLDFVDGIIARTQGKTSKFGGFLDSVVDRGVDCILICAFGFAEIVRWEIIIPLLIVSFLISYARSRAELASGSTVIFNVGIVERTERLVTVYIGLLLWLAVPRSSVWTAWKLNVAEVIFAILLVFSVYTLWQRMKYAYEKLR